MKIHFISFANNDSGFSTERIQFEADRMAVFNEITLYTEKDFDEEFLTRIGDELKTFKRGYGYWSWKPYIIRKELGKMDYGDVVVYADSGCMFARKNRKTLIDWVNIVKNSDSGILSPCYGPYIEHDWTRGDLYKYINETYNKDNIDIFDKAIQCGCGISLYCKNEKCIDFVNQWYDVMTNHFHLCTDEPSSVPNHPNFRENRHDQSVFSMLSKIYGIETIESSKGILDKENSPIIAARCKNDRGTWKKPIEVLFDSQIYDLQKFGGISRMYSDLSDELNRNEIVEKYTGSGVANGKYQDYYCRFSIGKTDNEYLKDEYCTDDVLSNKEKSLNEVGAGKFDVFYPTFFNPTFLKYIGNRPFVMSVHDMIPEIYDKYFSKKDLQVLGKKLMVKYASAIEVPTETTKKDLVRILGVDENKIHVVGRALSPGFGNKYYTREAWQKAINFKYILYVGQRNTYKRFDWFIKHIRGFMDSHKEIHLICTGNGFSEKEKELLTKYGLSDRTHSVFASDLSMASLYRYAEFFVFPSEYEGFGLPILESYKMGCIALLNDTEVFREVTENMGTYFKLSEEESDLSDVAERIFTMSASEKAALIKRQYEILAKHSFEKYVKNFRRFFESVLRKNDNEKKLDLFICTHKPFEPPVKNPCYKVINSSNINNDTAENGLPGSFYSEILIYLDVAKRKNLKDYVGFCHYRKYFSFMNDIPDMDGIFKEYDVVVAKPKKFTGTMREHYAKWHNVEDLDIVTDVIKRMYPEYYDVADKCFNKTTYMLPCNMFIMKREDFLEYARFIKGVLDEYLNVVGMDIAKRIDENKEKYLKHIKAYPQNGEAWYQFRIGGYLAERLTNVFIFKKFKKLKWYAINMTDGKYDTENQSKIR